MEEQAKEVREVKELGDLIVDQYGNYYHVVGTEDHKLVLVNAFIDYSFRFILREDFLKEHKGEYTGKVAMELLKNSVEHVSSGKVPLRIIPMAEFAEKYQFVVKPFFERNPQVKL